MKRLLGRFAARALGSDRPKVIAVFGMTRAEVECAIRHARTGSANLPIWAFCAEPVNTGSVAGCERFISGAGAQNFRDDLRRVWPALSIVAWTGKPGGFALKLWPLMIPPFRVLVLNEAAGLFNASPAQVAGHLKRRMRDGCISGLRRIGDWTRSLAWRTGERIRDGFNWIWESLFALLAFLAGWTPPLSRLVVQHLHSRRPLNIPFDVATSESFIEVTIPDRGWPRRALMRAARQSSAGFVVLRQRGERDAAEPLIAKAMETNAFAVAKQAAHSAWRRRIVAKHPFRRLQPGEVSEVFAPFSSLIVLRRDTLVRIGFPHALTFGTALLVLFWKASAAGLRSLAVGHTRIVGDESAMPLEDAELALRLALSSRLSALGPLRPARFRGNVAWSPSHRRDFRGMPRVLVVSPYLPFPLSHGGAVRIYNLCRAMAGEIDFVLACFRESGETVHYGALHEVFREVYIVDADEKHSDPAVPRQVAEYRNAAMSDLIRSLCAGRAIDLVQLEYTQLAEYRDETGGVPVILVEHDLTFTLYRQFADASGDAKARAEYQRWLEFERQALQCSNMIWTMSDEDRAVAIEHGAPRRRTGVIPNGVDLRRFTPEWSECARPPAVLFVGSFRHLPNLLAFEALRELVMPAVWLECPDAVLHVVAGPHYERAASLEGKTKLLAPDPRIVLAGFVEDVRPAYRDADVVAVPLPVSAGTNIKVLEAMACGRAVVSTPVGCHGLNLENGQELIVSEIGSFAGAIVNLLRDESLRTRIASEARRTVERRFGWDTIALEALNSYADLTRENRGAGFRPALV